MKANEAPEKIWVHELSAKELNVPLKEYHVEYIRADAFIEKAVNFLEMLGYGFTITDNITHTNYDKEQLIEDFEKYMRGE